MQSKVCPTCNSGNGLNMMKGEITQLMYAKTDSADAQSKIIAWTCGFCGYTETDTIQMTEGFGYVTATV